jgi:hypothetical protein
VLSSAAAYHTDITVNRDNHHFPLPNAQHILRFDASSTVTYTNFIVGHPELGQEYSNEVDQRTVTRWASVIMGVGSGLVIGFIGHFRL